MKAFLISTFLVFALVVQAQTTSKKSQPKTSTNRTSKAQPKSTPSKTPPKPASKAESKPDSKTSTEEPTEGPSSDGPPVAAVSSIEVEDIDGFEHYAPQIQELIRQSLALTKLNLTYTFGSADPKQGGMDCSGAIYYVLHEFGFKDVPRQSNEMAGWVKSKTLLYRVDEADNLSHPEFISLQPGNLLFWSGTYASSHREIPVTHVMLYLGKLKKSGKHIVFGASDGRAYQGKRRTGVSVFDFSLPRSTSSASFYGYGMIPGVGKIEAKPTPVKTEVIAAATPSASKAAPEKSMADSASSARSTKDAEDKEAQASKIASASTAFPGKGKSADSKKEPEEEVRTAVKVNPDKVEPAQVEADVRETRVADSTPKTVTKKPTSSVAASSSKTKAATSKTSATAKRSTTKSGSTSSSKSKSQSTPQRKAPAKPPTTLDRAKQATGSFINDVKRTFR